MFLQGQYLEDKKQVWFSEYFEKEVKLSPEDQKWIWYNAPHPKKNKIVSVNGNVNGTCKNGVNTELTLSKHRVITELKISNYRTSPNKVASLLEELFKGWETKDGHWLYVAQTWNPRAINWVIAGMTKQHRLGETTIKNPAKYFTSRIKFRKKRRSLRSNSDTYKQQL